MRGMAAGLGAVAVLAALPADGVALGRAGDPDPTFNGGAPVTVNLSQSIPRSSFFGDVLVDRGGRVLAAGSATDADGRSALAVARFRADGVLDPAFGTGGARVVQLGSGSNTFSTANSLFEQPGRYAGLGVFRNVATRGDHSALILREDGSSDLDVGSGGLMTKDPATAPAYGNTAAATAAPDGSVFVTGVLESNPMTGGNRLLQVTKFSAQGVPSPGFGNNGTVTFSRSESNGDTGTYGGALLPLPSERLLVGGVALLPSGRFGMLVARLSQGTGGLDTSFGTRSGSTLLNAADPSLDFGDSQVTDLARRADGALYLGGIADDANDRQAAVVVRLTAAGRPDFTFGTGGVKQIQFGGVEERSAVQAIAVQDDGKVVGVASVSPDRGGLGTSRIFRLNEDGALDPTFGTNGVVTVAMSAAEATISNGRLVVVGSLQDGPRADAALGRYLLAPLPDPPPAPPATPPGPTPGGDPPASGPSPAPPAVTPAGPATPVGKLTIAQKTFSVDARGRLRLPVTCSSAGRCAGRLGIVATSGRAVIAQSRRATVYAKASYALAPRGKRTVVLRLGPKTRSRARRGTGIAARLVVAPTGAKATVTKVRLRRPR